MLNVAERDVRITHPDKPLFSAGIQLTKLDLVRYYLAVAPGALNGIRDRPMMLKRFVDGAERASFYQKRAPEQRPPWLRTATLQFPSGREAEEVVVDDAALGELRLQRGEQLRVVARERPLVSTLQEDLAPVAEDQCAEAVPLRLEEPAVSSRQLVDTLGQHRRDRRFYGELHEELVRPRTMGIRGALGRPELESRRRWMCQPPVALPVSKEQSGDRRIG